GFIARRLKDIFSAKFDKPAPTLRHSARKIFADGAINRLDFLLAAKLLECLGEQHPLLRGCKRLPENDGTTHLFSVANNAVDIRGSKELVIFVEPGRVRR